MSCKKVSKELLSYVNGELTEHRTKEIRKWLEECSSQRKCTACQTKIAEYAAINQALETIPLAILPSHIHHSILEKVRLEETTHSKSTPRLQWKTLPVMFAVLLSLYSGSLISNKIFNPASNKTSADIDLISLQENSLVEVFTTEGVTP